MKVKIKNTKLNESIKYFLYFILIIVCTQGIAQANFCAGNIVLNSSDDQICKVISFGEKIDFGKIENNL